jgi:hypothetical protein
MKRLICPETFARVRTRLPRLQLNSGLFEERESRRQLRIPYGSPARVSMKETPVNSFHSS